MPIATSTAAYRASSARSTGDREHVVFLEQLDGAFGPARGRRDEQRRLAAVAEPADLGDPVGDASVQFDRRLTADVLDARALVQGKLRQAGRLRQARLHAGPVGEQSIGRRRWACARVPDERFLVAALDRFDQLLCLCVDFVALRDDQARFLDARQVVEKRRRPIVAEHVVQRNDGQLIDRLDGSLGRGIVGSERFDRVADELEPDRPGIAGGIDVHDAAADRELAVLVRRIFAAEPGIDEKLAEIGRGDVLIRPQIDRGAQHARRAADARQQRRGRRDDDSARAARQGVEGPGACRGDADVRRHPAVRVDFMGGERQHRSSTAASESPSSAARKNCASATASSRSASLGTTYSTAPFGSAWAAAATYSAFAEAVRPETTRAGPSIPLRAIAVLRTARRFREVEVVKLSPNYPIRYPIRDRILSTIAVVEWPGSMAMRTTRPPLAFDDVAADDGVLGPVGAFDEHIRLKAGNHLMRRVLVEDDDGVDAVERRENLGALALGSDRPAAAFDRPNGAIGIQPDNERVAQGAGLPQIPDVAGMQEIEDPVRERHLPTLMPATVHEGGRRGSAQCRHVTPAA